MMAWEQYGERISKLGGTRRNVAILRESREINNKIVDNPSYQQVEIHDLEHGYNILSEEMSQYTSDRNVVIINSDNLNEKYIFSLPGEDLEHGDLVHWMDNYWLITERDANSTIYTRCKMVQCNHLLKWVSDDNTICEQWCIIEDGTKYLTGEYEDRSFIVTRGDSRIAMTLARNSKTSQLTRSNRFLIDDPDSPVQLAYLLSKPLKLGWSFNNKGCYKFVLQESQNTIYDNFDLGIADYYKHFDNEGNPIESTGAINPGTNVDENGRSVWL